MRDEFFALRLLILKLSTDLPTPLLVEGLELFSDNRASSIEEFRAAFPDENAEVLEQLHDALWSLHEFHLATSNPDTNPFEVRLIMVPERVEWVCSHCSYSIYLDIEDAMFVESNLFIAGCPSCGSSTEGQGDYSC